MTITTQENASPFAAPRRTVAIIIAGILAYPFLLQFFRLAGRATGDAGAAWPSVVAWTGVVLFMALAFALPIMGFFVARASSELPLSEQALFQRRAAHLAFATPSLYVAAGGYAGLVKLSAQETLLWIGLWLAVAALLFWRAPARERAAGTAGAPSWLPVVHGSVAAALVLIFLAGHLTNHLSALLGLEVQRAIMHTLRLWYRSSLVQPILVAGFLFMIGSGLLLARARTTTYTDRLGTLQTLTGIYLAAFLFSHLTSAFSARSRGIDTDWLWATSAPEGLLAGYVRLIPHYTLGVACLITHLGCGLRVILLHHGVARRTADRITWSIAAGGALLAGLIMAGMLGLRL